MAQTYTDFELIILNDASPENVREIIERFQDPRIRYFENKKNLGAVSLARTWNICLERAAGEYFVMFSDDDEYDKDFLNEMLALATKYPGTDLFHSRVLRIDTNGKPVSHTPTCPEFESGIDFIWHRIMKFRYYYAPDFMCRTKALEIYWRVRRFSSCVGDRAMQHGFHWWYGAGSRFPRKYFAAGESLVLIFQASGYRKTNDGFGSI